GGRPCVRYAALSSSPAFCQSLSTIVLRQFRCRQTGTRVCTLSLLIAFSYLCFYRLHFASTSWANFTASSRAVFWSPLVLLFIVKCATPARTTSSIPYSSCHFQ